MSENLPDDFAQALCEATGRLGGFAGRVRFLPVVSSTNDVAVGLAADGADHGTTVLAGTQTAGRGRQGRAWFSPDGAGLYFSSVLRGLQPELVTLMAGAAICEAVRTAVGLPAELKWPNDVVIQATNAPRRHPQTMKLAGILTETSRGGGVADAIIVGVGINVARSDYPPDLGSKATSLEAELGAPVDRAAVFVEALAALSRWQAVLAAGRAARLLERWRALAPSSNGVVVAWDDHGTRRRGVTDGIDRDGALRVRCAGRTERIVAGSLTWLGDPAGEGSGADRD